VSSFQVYIDARAMEATAPKVWDDPVVLHDLSDRIRTDMGRMYRLLDRIDARVAELRGPADLPRPSRRTPTQQRVSKCPRCGDRSETAA